MNIETKKILFTTIFSYSLLSTTLHLVAESSTTAPSKFIYANTIGTTGYTISNPGYYVLVEDVIFSPNANDLSAIITATDHVTINLNDHSIYQYDISRTDVYGIKINSIAHDVTIQNGSLCRFTGYGIYVDNSCYNINLENIKINNATCTSALKFVGTSGNEIHDVVIENCKINGITATNVVDFDFCDDIEIKNSNFNNNQYAGQLKVFAAQDCNSCRFTNCQFNDNTTTDTGDLYCLDASAVTTTAKSIEVYKCLFNTNSCSNGLFRGIQFSHSGGGIIKECTLSKNSCVLSACTAGISIPIDIVNGAGDKIYSCIISDNSITTSYNNSPAELYGICLSHSDSSGIYITDCLTTRNTAEATGTGSSNAECYGIYLYQGNYHFVENCTSLNNQATSSNSTYTGVGIVNKTTSSVILNCSTFGNSEWGIWNNADSIVGGCSSGYNGVAGAGNYGEGINVPNVEAVTKLGDNATTMERYGNADINS